MTAAPALSRVLADAGVQPHDVPSAAAALLWDSLVERFSLRTDGPLGPLGVLDRTVLVLLDGAALGEVEVAAHLNTDVTTVRAAHAAARARVGLPPLDAPACPGWDRVRAAHPTGDPRTLTDLLVHVHGCDSCHAAAPDVAPRRTGARSIAVVSAPAASNAFGVLPAFAATAATIAVTAAVVAVGGALSPVPAETRLPVPVVVDDDPGLPTDDEPAAGWTSPTQDTSVLEPDGDAPTEGPTSGEPDDDPAQDVTDTVDDVTDTVEDLTDDVTDTVDDVTDTVDDVTDDVTDTVDDLTDEVDDTLDGADDTLDDVTDPLEDVTDLP